MKLENPTSSTATGISSATTSDQSNPMHQVLELSDVDNQAGMEQMRTSSDDPFVLSFSNLTYSVNLRRRSATKPTYSPRKNRVGGVAEGLKPYSSTSVATRGNFLNTSKVQLINDISGEAREGEILAILGASGSGKSTLIDALANRIAKGSLKGSVTLNGEALESRLLKVISTYVMQDDLLFPMLTVEETLMFSAEFRLPRYLPKSKKKERVGALINQLGLQNVATTMIGDEGHRGVSGGERRRVSIGVDIIHDPIILFLDEPTSGLDSTSAFKVVKVLQRIAQSGSVVIMSIHQPSYRILGLVDHLIFLSCGQSVCSVSPTNLPRFFSEFGQPIQGSENGTEFVLDLISELEESPDGTKRLVEFNKSWQSMNKSYHRILDSHRRLSLKDAINASISRGKLVSGAANGTTPMSSMMVSSFVNPFWFEIIVLAKRSITNSRRMPERIGIQLGAVVIAGIIMGTLFWQLDHSPRGAQERLGVLAFAMSTIFYISADSLPIFIQERYIFMRETAYNTYRRSSYVLAHSIIVMPSLILISFAFATTTFWSVGLAGGFHGFIFFLMAVLASFWTGSSFVTFLSGVIPNVMLGYTIVVAILAYFLLFCGFFLSRDRIPPYWIWFHYISLTKYPFEGVMLNEFDNTSKCFARGVQMFDNTLLADIPTDTKVELLKTLSTSLGMNLTTSTCVTTGIDILRKQGVTQLSKWSCLWITLAWGFFFRILFYVSLLLGSKNKRR